MSQDRGAMGDRGETVSPAARGDRAPLGMGAASLAAMVVVLLLGHTWRVARSGLLPRDRARGRGDRCIFAVWHGRMLPMVFTERGQGAVVLVSRHRDGELIARIIGWLGFRTVRGSSTRGGDEALRSLLREAGEQELIAITPDGPRGPAERVKPGLVYLASRSGLPIVPVASSARDSWVLSSWDRFRIPKPFSRVVIAYGDPIRVPPELDDEHAADWCRRIEAALGELNGRVARQSGEAP